MHNKPNNNHNNVQKNVINRIIILGTLRQEGNGIGGGTTR